MTVALEATTVTVTVFCFASFLSRTRCGPAETSACTGVCPIGLPSIHTSAQGMMNIFNFPIPTGAIRDTVCPTPETPVLRAALTAGEVWAVEVLGGTLPRFATGAGPAEGNAGGAEGNAGGCDLPPDARPLGKASPGRTSGRTGATSGALEMRVCGAVAGSTLPCGADRLPVVASVEVTLALRVSALTSVIDADTSCD